MSTKTFPSLNLENEFFAAGKKYVIGIDEVGRGAIAGPVAVCAAALDLETIKTEWPTQLRDSKLLSEKVREELFEPTGAWVRGFAVGMTSATDIDADGIVPALANAARKALADLKTQLPEATIENTQLILDGSHNWLKGITELPTVVQVKADRDCVSVACASVLAKVTRDRLMIELDGQHPGFGLAGHKGYASAAHIAALKSQGPSAQHRHTWLAKILATESTDASQGLDF